MEWSGTGMRKVQATHGQTHPMPHTSPLSLVGWDTGLSRITSTCSWLKNMPSCGHEALQVWLRHTGVCWQGKERLAVCLTSKQTMCKQSAMQIAGCMKTQHGTIPVACVKVSVSVYKLFIKNIVPCCQTLILSFVVFASAPQTQLCKEVNSMEFNEG